jgi:general secretion pathway protein B
VANAPTNASEERAPALAELPDELRRALPALHFDGAVYSDKPANRILMVNGQLLHEGESITPELSIERINPKGAVLSFRGHRFELTR